MPKGVNEMGLHINKQANLDEMLNKFAKINPKDNQRSDYMKKEDTEDRDAETKRHDRFFKKDDK
ncbi:SPJ_0845 family protein [Fructilactobacillus cliffordii]|uniref:Uncharacterized protein n=1 Tax=Fructilactobacillus cliffordii TaxID=2940299 RepID=A0A9Q8ZU91_9LACO|nr:SPJ_0845 family protein [Fructilactobacillus cliffordii]USS89505.1 hypothetical protein M3M40_01575 [Fructilactobacillus cliffordii]